MTVANSTVKSVSSAERSSLAAASSSSTENLSREQQRNSLSGVKKTHKNNIPPFLPPLQTGEETTKSKTSNVSACKKSCQMMTKASSILAGTTRTKGKGDSRLLSGPSPLRQLLPIAFGLLSFATVLSILLIYIDTTEIKHQQFRLNMSRDYELIGVHQDDPELIAFIRQIHMKKYPMNFLKNAPEEHLNFTERHELTPEMAHYVADLVGDKTNGSFIQSMTGSTSYALTAPWLAETLSWSGLIVEPEPRRYFSLRKQNAHRPKVQVVHACLSPNGHPKEISIHNDEDVRINSLVDEETSWFNSRVKCFPLYTLMLAVNRTDYDLLSIGCPGHELQILQTLPFSRVNIAIISIHLTEAEEYQNAYIQTISKFLLGKLYKLQRKFETNYIYKRIASTNNNNNRNIPAAFIKSSKQFTKL